MICKNVLNESTYPLQSDCETRLIIFQFLVSLGKNEQMNHLPPEHEQEDKAILPNNSSRSWDRVRPVSHYIAMKQTIIGVIIYTYIT